jgi:hypothetical protein
MNCVSGAVRRLATALVLASAASLSLFAAPPDQQQDRFLAK